MTKNICCLYIMFYTWTKNGWLSSMLIEQNEQRVVQIKCCFLLLCAFVSAICFLETNGILNWIVKIVDGQNVKGPAAAIESNEEAYRSRQRREDDENRFTWPRMAPVDLENMARDAFGRIDDIHDEVLNEQDQ